MQCCCLLTTAVPPVHAIYLERLTPEELTPRHPARVATKIRPNKQTAKGGIQMTFHERYLAGCAALAVAALVTVSPTRAQDAAALNAEAAQNDWPTHHGTYKSCLLYTSPSPRD